MVAFFTALPSHAAEGPGDAGAGLMRLVAVIVLLVAVGLGLGCFGLTVNNLFRQRAALSFAVLSKRPRLSLLTGVVVTALGLGLVAVLAGAGPLPILVLAAYLGFLGLFALGCAARLAGEHVEPAPLDGELPTARAHVKGGVLLLGVNAVPILGSILFFGILLAGVGASLLAYFARFVRDAPSVAASTSGASAPGTQSAPGSADGERLQ